MAASTNLVKATITLKTKSGIAVDSVQNDLYYIAPAGPPSDSDLDNFRDHIQDFYGTVATGGVLAVGAYMSPSLDASGPVNEIAFYNVPAARGPLGAPFAMRDWSLTTIGTNPLPEEVASVLGFRDEYGSAPEFGPGRTTRPRARLRGRIFIGPLALTASVTDSTTHRTMVAPAFVQSYLASAIEYLYTEMFGDAWNWRVFSTTTWTDHPVFFVNADNAFDTQRRRGPAATAKTEAPVA